MVPNMSTSSTDSCDQYVPHGFNPTKFRQQRQASLSSRTTITQNKSDALPFELQYNNLLKRGIHILQKRKKNAELKLNIDVRRESSTKTSINLREIATILNRDEDHFMKFLLAELVTAGNVTQEGRIFVRGCFLSQNVREVVRKYIEAYVVCKGCESVQDTSLAKENKLLLVKCKACGSKRHVGNFK